MIYKLLGDFLIIVHFFWIIFILFGLLLALKSFKFAVIHMAGLVFTLVLNLGGWYCPLTYLENHLHGLYAQQLTYTGSFIINNLQKLIYVDLEEAYLRVGAIAWVVLNMAGYGLLARKRMLGLRAKGTAPGT